MSAAKTHEETVRDMLNVIALQRLSVSEQAAMWVKEIADEPLRDQDKKRINDRIASLNGEMERYDRQTAALEALLGVPKSVWLVWGGEWEADLSSVHASQAGAERAAFAIRQNSHFAKTCVVSVHEQAVSQ